MLRTRFLVGALLACTVFFFACGQDRAAGNAERAQALLAEGELEKAMIELHTALRLDPDNADYSQRIAELLVIMGESADARFYFGEAYRLDRQRFEAAIRLATLQFAMSPEESHELIEEVAANGPDSAWGEIGRSQQAIYDLDLAAALEHAERGAELEPDNADAHWQVAIANVALVRTLTRLERDASNTRFAAALNALDRFAELSPARSWRAVAEKAQIYTGWPGHDVEARESLHVASDRLGELGLLRPEFEVLDRALIYARAVGDVALEEWALRRKIERVPQLYPAWEELAELYEKTGRDPTQVYLLLKMAFPKETEPLILLAGYERRTKGRRSSIKLLEKSIANGHYAAPLLVAIAMDQSFLGKRAESLKTITKLNAQFPNSRESVVMNAWGWFQSRKPEISIEILSEHSWTAEDASAQRLLVDAYTMLGDTPKVVQSLERLLKLLPDPDLALRRRYARALFDDNQFYPARDAYRELRDRNSLLPDEVTRYAVTLFETGAHAIGRRMLETAVGQPNPSKLAALALFERDGATERNRDRLRAAFLALLEPNAVDPEILSAYVRFEIEAKTPNRALATIERSLGDARLGKGPLAQILTLKAAVQDAKGDKAGARKTAIEVLDVAPSMPGALEFAQSLYTTKAEALAAIAELTNGVKNDDQPAQRHALLGRLYYRAGNIAMARVSYEQALTGGLELPILKNDLAFLLAVLKLDLPRAKVLALQADQALPNQPGVLDTLGYVLLQLEDYRGSAKQLQQGIEIAQTHSAPHAELQYHLGLAFIGLDRMSEAESAFAAALELDEDFPDKANARMHLAKIRGDI